MISNVVLLCHYKSKTVTNTPVCGKLRNLSIIFLSFIEVSNIKIASSVKSNMGHFT